MKSESKYRSNQGILALKIIIVVILFTMISLPFMSEKVEWDLAFTFFFIFMVWLLIAMVVFIDRKIQSREHTK